MVPPGVWSGMLKMKTTIILLGVGLLVAVGVMDAGAAVSKAQVTFKVVDDAGSPVAGMPIVSWASPSIGLIPDIGYSGPNKDAEKRWVTDKDGVVIVTMPSSDGEMEICVDIDEYNKKTNAKTVSYYWEMAGTDFCGTEEKNGQWQPWNPTVAVTLKRIKHPIPMYARKVETKIPALGKPCGYDLVKSDWVAPYGKGEKVDFVFSLDKKFDKTIEWDSNNPWLRKRKQKESARLHDTTFSVGFSNAGDGIQSVYANGGSGLRLPYTAPDADYVAKLSRRSYRNSREEKEHRDNSEHFNWLEPHKSDQNYFFRVRSEKRDGKPASTLYGKIHGEIEWDLDGTLKFTYYLNPTPNDRNLEFDPKKNLFGEPSCRAGSDQSMAVHEP
jgi:hypothetical protein